MAITSALPARVALPRPDGLRAVLARLAVAAAIGAELLALVALTPDTLDVFLRPSAHGYGDFDHFYENSRHLSLSGTYNPVLSVLLHPLTYLSLAHAFQVFFAFNLAALVAVAWIAQRAVFRPDEKVAVALLVLALPQTHWALRIGHFTEVLAFIALAGFLLARDRPALGGAVFAALALKPQYLPVPVLYLLWTRNWAALRSLAGVLLAMSLAGVAAAGVSAGAATSYYADRAVYIARDLAVGQQELLLPVQQAWQYSWRGFLVSAGFEPNPLLIADLLALSAAAMLFAWWRCTPAATRAAAAIGMLLLAPYSTFYNWSMIAVAVALLLRAELRPRWVTPALIAGFALAAAATQAATPFPSPDDFAPAETRGLYWLQPMALLAIFVLAFAGRRAAVEPAPEHEASRRWTLPDYRLPSMPAAALALSLVALAGGYGAAAYVSGNAPFVRATGFERQVILRALPADFPAPDGAPIAATGAGASLPYRVEWRTDGPVSEVAGVMRQRLEGRGWTFVSGPSSADSAMRVVRSSGGQAELIGSLTLEQRDDATLVVLEFAPLPVTSIDGYDEWLRDRGIVVKNVDPSVYDELRTR